MPSPLQRSHRGFTLIEVLVALVVLATSLAAGIAATTRYASNTAYLRDRSFAHWVAMNRITEVYLEDDWPGTGSKRGEEEMAGHEWPWLRRVVATADEDVRRIEVEVRVDADDERPVALLTAFVGRPR